MKSAREILSENLQKLIKERGIDQRALAAYLNVSDATVSYWINGDKYPRIDKIQKIADFFNVPKSRLTEEQPNNLVNIAPPTIPIPILGKIACGEPILANENIENYIFKSRESLPSGEVFGLIAKGDSMEPTIPNGAIVLIRAQPDVENGEIAAVLVNNDEEATLKRIKKEGDTVWLIPDNPKYPFIKVSKEHPARIIGKAISYEMKL
ncbi:XRE family transcriptional regulator [Aeribacillus sp. FSL K6-1121]|jgi:repressor LexA|uniref:LexA family protein n=1 Tax=Aeribacillus sp. FSL K6-1121 TaxID=2954745 RepID=UPI0030F63213